MIITFDTSKLLTPFKYLGAKATELKHAVGEARMNAQARRFLNDYERRLEVTKRAIELSKNDGELAGVFFRAASMDKHETKKPKAKVVKIKDKRNPSEIISAKAKAMYPSGTSRLNPAVQPAVKKRSSNK